MGRRNINKSVAVVSQEATAVGARVVLVRNGRKHHHITVETACGMQFIYTVSASPRDPYKIKGWFRQALNRALKERCSPRH